MAMEMSLMESGIVRLQSSAGLGFVGVGGAPRELGSIWRWGALLLLAALAAYGSLIVRVRLLLRRLHGHLRRAALPQPSQQNNYDDSDDDTCSLCSDDDDTCSEEEELLSSAEDAEEEKAVVREGYFGDYAESEGPNGGFDLRGGREVVRAWGSRDLRFHDSAALGCVVSLCDLDRGEVVRSFTAGDCPVAAACVTAAQPAVVLSAGGAVGGPRVELRLWDARVGGRAPSALADLSPRLRRRVQRLGGAGKVVYVGDAAGSAAAVDLRTAQSPMGRVAEEEATWWDTDAILVGGGDVAGFFQEGAPWAASTYRFRARRK